MVFLSQTILTILILTFTQTQWISLKTMKTVRKSVPWCKETKEPLTCPTQPAVKLILNVLMTIWFRNKTPSHLSLTSKKESQVNLILLELVSINFQMMLNHSIWVLLLEMEAFLTPKKPKLLVPLKNQIWQAKTPQLEAHRTNLKLFMKWNTPHMKKLETTVGWHNRSQSKLSDHLMLTTPTNFKKTCFWASTIGQKLKLLQLFNPKLKIQFSLKKTTKGKICWKYDN